MGWCCQRTQWSVPATCVSLCVCALAVYCYVCRNDLRFVCQLKKQTAAKHLQDVAHTPRCHRQASKKGHPGYGSSAKGRKMIAVWRGEGCGVRSAVTVVTGGDSFGSLRKSSEERGAESEEKCF